MEEIGQFIWQRLEDMHRTPEMWAITREAFGMAIVQLVEVACVAGMCRDSRRGIDHLKTEIFGSNADRMAQPIDIEWAWLAVEIGRGFLLEYKAEVRK